MATVRHVTAWAGRTKFQAAWFLLNRVYRLMPAPVVARFKARVCGCSLAVNAGLNPAGGTDIRLLWVFVLSRRGLCVRLITLPEESYWVWRVWVRSWSLDEESLAHWRLLHNGRKKYTLTYTSNLKYIKRFITFESLRIVLNRLFKYFCKYSVDAPLYYKNTLLKSWYLLSVALNHMK